MPEMRAGSGQLTYLEVGATRGPLPAGYHQVAARRRIGMGHTAFADAAETLLGWDMHRRAGLAVPAGQPRAAAGETVLLGLPWALRALGMAAAPCQVVYTVDEPLRRGFAYGTLPGHPECGEESFLVELDAETGEAWGRITAFSRPAHWLARLAGPLGRAAQTAMTRRYLRALAG